jgi:signal transduction histidine kinase/ActR/RegA family two-component response regulator
MTFGVVCVGILIALSCFFCVEKYISFKKDLLNKTHIISDIVSSNISAAIAFSDKITATEIISGLSSDDSIIFACITNKEGEIFASYANSKQALHAPPKPDMQHLLTSGERRGSLIFLFSSYQLELLQDIHLQKKKIGSIYIVASMNKLHQDFQQFFLLTFCIAITIFIIAMIFNAHMQGIILNPINDLVSAMTHVSKSQNYALRVRKRGNDELGRVVDGFNEMLETIENNRVLLDKTLKAESEAKKQAMEASESKSRFLANMSHEIRTPMNGVLGMIQVLQKTRLTKQQYKYTELIRISGENLLSLINDLLDFSKIEAHKMQLVLGKIDPYRLFAELHDMMEVQARDKGLILSTMVCTNVPTPLEGDSERISQIIINLVGNGIKFTQTGHVMVKVVATQSTPRSITLGIHIEDTGIGISREVQKHIFDSFVQADDSTTRKFGGTGLGLAVTKQLVTMMHGNIDLSSEPHKGSTFRVSLLLGRTRETKPFPLTFSVPDTPPVELEEQSACTQNHQQMKILIAEDNEVNQEVLVDVLKFMGCSVTLAVNGEKAVYLASRERFDLILMDCQMPVMDGFEATRRIRALKDPALANVPIVAMTALAQTKDREACIEAGMNDYQSKPFSMDKLEACIEKWTGGKKKQDL